MKYTYNSLSEQYQQVYVAFEAAEIEEIFFDIESSLDMKALQKFHSDDEYFKEKFYERIIAIVEDELSKQEVIIISERIYKILSIIRRNKPLIVTVTYCVYDEDFDFVEQNIKIKKDELVKLSDNYLKSVLDLIMLQKGYYKLVKSDKVLDDSEVGFIKLPKDNEKEEVIFPNEENYKFYKAFLNKKLDDIVTINKKKYQITSIRKRKILELDDRIASLIDPWNAKSASAFIDHIREIEQFYFDVDQSINKMVEILLDEKILEWDMYTLNHYKELIKTPFYMLAGQPIIKVKFQTKEELLYSLSEQMLCAYVMSRNNVIRFRNEDKVKKINQLYFLKHGLVKGLEDTNDLVNSQAIRVLVYEFLEDALIIV